MPSPNLPQGITDPLNAGFQAATCLALDAYNTRNNVASVALADAQSAAEPTAEWRNTVNAALRSFADYVQGLTPITALQIATYFRVPRYTTAQLTDPLAVSQGEGALAYDTTIDRLCTSTGVTWIEYLASGDVSSDMHIVEVNGDVDDSFTQLQFNGDVFALTNNGDTTVEVTGIVDGSIALSKLSQSANARSIPVRSANTAGAVAYLQLNDGEFLGCRSNTLDGYVPAVNDLADQTLYSVDLSTLATNTLTSGAEVIDGFTWTAGNSANATTFEVTNGTGIHFDASTANTAYTTSSRTAPNISIAVNTLIPSWDPLRTYIIEVYFSSLTLGTSGNRVLVCLENTTVSGQERLMGGGRRNNAGAQQTYNQERTTLVVGATLSHDCFALRFSNGTLQVLSGVSSGGDFPSSYGHAQSGSPVDGISVMATSSMLTIAFVTGEAGGAMDAVLRRLRVRRING